MKRPMVFGGTGKRRRGKGFSIPEIQKIGKTISELKKLGIPVDTRRKSLREENVKLLQELIKQGKE